MNNYKIEVSKWKKVEVKNAEFVLRQGEDYVKYLSDVSQRITNRTYSVLTVLGPIFTALVVFLIRSASTQSKDWFLIVFTSSVVVSLVVLIISVGRNIMPRTYMPVGRSPEEICDEDYLVGKDSYLAMVLNEIENCQSKIYFNENQNGHRHRRLTDTMRFLAWLFVGSLLAVAAYLPYSYGCL